MNREYEEGDRAEAGRLLTERDDLSAAYYQQIRDQARREVEDKMSALVRRNRKGGATTG